MVTKLLIVALLCSGGCSLLTDFDGYHFAAAADGGTAAALDAGHVPTLDDDAGTLDASTAVADASVGPLDAGDVDAGASMDASIVAQLDAGDAAAEQLDASDVDSAMPAPDAGPPLRSCNDRGFGLYIGACRCSLTACACKAACSDGASVVCCDNNAALQPICACGVP